MQLPKFLFIFTPPYCGTTALSEVLNTSPASMLLNPRGEGQWLVPSLCADDRWNPEKVIDWPLVRKTWLDVYHKINMLVGNIGVIIEKSPANIVRIKQFMEVFPGSSCFVFNRNPYAHCCSSLYRDHSPDKMSAQEKTVILERLANGWVSRSEYLYKAINEMQLLNFTYEEFCGQPEKYAGKVLEICPELVSVDCSRPIEVKDYPPQRLSNQNQRQISLLSPHDIECISGILRSHTALLSSFGYSVM